MTYVVTEACIKCKYMDCVEVCPVDCFYEGENMLVINPDECIDCGVCEPECPPEAILPDTETGPEQWLELNRQYCRPSWPNITRKGERAGRRRRASRAKRASSRSISAPSPAGTLNRGRLSSRSRRIRHVAWQPAQWCVRKCTWTRLLPHFVLIIALEAVQGSIRSPGPVVQVALRRRTGCVTGVGSATPGSCARRRSRCR